MTIKSIFIKQKSTWAGKIVAVLQAIHFFPLAFVPFALFHFSPSSRLPITTFLDTIERRQRIQALDATMRLFKRWTDQFVGTWRLWHRSASTRLIACCCLMDLSRNNADF